MKNLLHCCHTGQSPLAAVVIVAVLAAIMVDVVKKVAMKKAAMDINKDMNS